MNEWSRLVVPPLSCSLQAWTSERTVTHVNEITKSKGQVVNYRVERKRNNGKIWRKIGK